MAGLKDIKPNSFKKVEQRHEQTIATNVAEFVNQAEGETSKIAPKKRGAPLKSETNKRTQKALVYFTEREILKVQEMAEEKNMKITEFIRFKIFN